MKQKALFLALLACITHSFCTANEPTTTNSTEHTTVLSEDSTSSIYSSFSNFTRTFVALFSNEKIQNSIESIETMLTNLIHSSFDIIKSKKTRSMLCKDGSMRVEFIDENDQEVFIELLVRESKELTLKKTNNAQQKNNGDDNQVIILGHFARIAQNFFNIVQAPENREIVIPNLLGMFAGIVNIGSEVIKRSNLHVDADLHDIQAYVEQLNTELKNDIFSILTQQTETRSISHTA